MQVAGTFIEKGAINRNSLQLFSIEKNHEREKVHVAVEKSLAREEVNPTEIFEGLGAQIGKNTRVFVQHKGFPGETEEIEMPRLLSENHKRKFLSDGEGDAFLDRIVTYDESRVHDYTLKLKQASRPVTIKPSLSEIMRCFRGFQP